MRYSLRGILPGIVFLLVVLTLSVCTARATPSLDLGSDTGSATVTLPITLTNEPGTDIVATSNDIEYDTNYFSLGECTLGPAGSSANKEVQCSLPSNGVLRVVVTGLTLDPIPDGVVTNITFNIDDETPCGQAYTLLNTPSASDALGGLVTVEGTDGEISVSCESAIPTLNEWGLIIFMTVMLGIGVMILRKREIY